MMAHMSYSNQGFPDNRPRPRNVSREEALRLEGYKHACHVLFHAPTSAKLFERVPIRHVLLMMMRFDGRLGFPGGFVDVKDSSLEAGLNREVEEELGCSSSKFEVTEKDYRSAQVREFPQKCVTHFYIKELELEDMDKIESECVNAKDHGIEVMGLVRVPLYTLRDGMGGLPAFLCNNFIGNSKSQLLYAIRSLHLLREDQIQEALRACHGSQY
ncbi:U8 snoRNA-decapping enzyme [Pelobates cultripes]|uniref:U8 snoRNA-decapping enzyme n=2 Tax=Pelobates cultripes TaxID=61616 RepID=A0AAD1T493_PELCU|nr:U8 snoRNA-decapping enzyme [Pelobates cultripes]